jgi:hypothetical protein
MPSMTFATGSPRRPVAIVPLLLAIVAVVVGCGRQGPVVQFVEGIVLLDGAPVAGANVAFSPTGAEGLPAVGRTNESGIFHLTSTRGGRPEKGAAVGAYAVTITKAEYDLGGKPPPADGDYSNVPVRHVVPEAYGSAATSGLTATVKPGGGNVDTFRFELVRDFKGGRTGP